MVQIQLHNVSLRFRIRQRGRIPLKDFLVQGWYRRSVNPIVEVNALKDISVTFEQGERIGIIGHNGAGKSTLLKVLAGIYPPTSGQVMVEGQVNSMLDIGVGIEAEATGWDNIAYRSYLLGATLSQVKRKREAVAEFSKLGDALHMPVRCYSTGMLVRLLFSIATEVDPEILLLDEILGAGDLSFQEKAQKRMFDLMDRARLIVLASHDLVTLKKMCGRILWLDHGRIRMEGPPEDVIPAYQEFMIQESQAVA
jgi:ABC-type polysaccharide/polyol phosphate transport system ATPase subunit